VRGPSPSAVATALRGRRAFVAGPLKNCAVIFDCDSDRQDPEQISGLAQRLSQALACPVLAASNHDDDVLWYRLYVAGLLRDEYNSWLGYFDSAVDSDSPSGGNAEELCAAFGAPNSAAVERVLRKPSLGNDGYVFAQRRHADLIRVLDIPDIALGTAYASVANGRFPEGLSAAAVLEAVDAPGPPSPEDIQREHDLKFYDRLGSEDASKRCNNINCDRGPIPMSVMCRPHHFEMILGRTCPFDH